MNKTTISVILLIVIGLILSCVCFFVSASSLLSSFELNTNLSVSPSPVVDEKEIEIDTNTIPTNSLSAWSLYRKWKGNIPVLSSDEKELYILNSTKSPEEIDVIDVQVGSLLKTIKLEAEDDTCGQFVQDDNYLYLQTKRGVNLSFIKISKETGKVEESEKTSTQVCSDIEIKSGYIYLSSGGQFSDHEARRIAMFDKNTLEKLAEQYIRFEGERYNNELYEVDGYNVTYYDKENENYRMYSIRTGDYLKTVNFKSTTNYIKEYLFKGATTNPTYYLDDGSRIDVKYDGNEISIVKYFPN